MFVILQHVLLCLFHCFLLCKGLEMDLGTAATWRVKSSTQDLEVSSNLHPFLSTHSSASVGILDLRVMIFSKKLFICSLYFCTFYKLCYSTSTIYYCIYFKIWKHCKKFLLWNFCFGASKSFFSVKNINLGAHFLLLTFFDNIIF